MILKESDIRKIVRSCLNEITDIYGDEAPDDVCGMFADISDAADEEREHFDDDDYWREKFEDDYADRYISSNW